MPERSYSSFVKAGSKRATEEKAYFETHHAINIHAIDIVRLLKAAKITSTLNLRIRRPYVFAQLLSRPLTGDRLTASSNPLAFTCRFYQN